MLMSDEQYQRVLHDLGVLTARGPVLELLQATNKHLEETIGRLQQRAQIATELLGEKDKSIAALTSIIDSLQRLLAARPDVESQRVADNVRRQLQLGDAQ